MSLSPFNPIFNKARDLYGFFVDVFNHLNAKNYDNKTYTPTITGLTGSPTVTAWYQRFGVMCNVFIMISGTHTIDTGTISLPDADIDSNGYGVAIIHSLTDGSTLGTGTIDHTNSVIDIGKYWVTSEDVLIKGFYKVKGI